MPFSLKFADKYRLWSELLYSNTERVFVPTEALPALGQRLPVELLLESTAVRIVLSGTVVGLRQHGGRFPAGAFLRFEHGEVEKCRRFLGLNEPGHFERGRKAPRVRCALEVAFPHRTGDQKFELRNLSATGLSCLGPGGLREGERLGATLTLDDHGTVAVEGEVTWTQAGSGLLGLRFMDLSDETRERITDSVNRMLDARSGDGEGHVVVADDEPEILSFLKLALERHGYGVQTARRGDEALNLIRALSPRLVLLDVLMPGMDGVEICRVMRADVELYDVPVVFVSALEEQRLHDMAHQAGASDFLCKPVNLADLLNTVGRYLRRRTTPSP